MNDQARSARRFAGAVAGVAGPAFAIPLLLDPFSEAAASLLAAVHVRGLIERRQPSIEHAEIIGWSAMAIAARRYAPRRRCALR